MTERALSRIRRQPQDWIARQSASRIWPLVAAIVAALLALPMLWAPLSIFDSGIAASAGTFILHGRIPYRDFWLLYGPLTPFLAALLTAVFGNNLSVLRLTGIVIVASTAIIGYRLVRDRAPGAPGVVLAVVAAAISVRWTGVDLWPWALAMALVLGAIACADRKTNRSLVVSGVLLGLAVLARQDLGGYGLIAVLISFRSLRPLAGAAVVVVPIAAVFLFLVPIADLLQQLVWYPLVGQREFRGLPAPSLTSILESGWAVGWLLFWPAVAIIVLAVVRYGLARSIPTAYGALAILAILCRLQTLWRFDGPHAAEAMAPAILLLGYVLPRPTRSIQRIGLAVGAGLLLGLSALPLTLVGAPQDPYDVALSTAADVVRANTQPNEPIFVGEVRNLHTLLNPLIEYYLADRPPGVHATMFNPGVTNTAATQAQMVADLEANRVRFLILGVRFADCFEPANESRLAGPLILDQAIDRDYEVVANFGSVVIMNLRNSSSSVVDVPSLWVDPLPPEGGTMTCPAN